MEINVPIEKSEDARGDDTAVDRGQVELDLEGRSAEDVRREMQEVARRIQDADIDYGGLDDNSNSTIRTRLKEIGIDPTLSNDTTEENSPGWDDILPIPQPLPMPVPVPTPFHPVP